MRNIELEDDFFPSASIHRDFRRSPKAIVNQFQDVLRNNGFSTRPSNTTLMLSTGRALYTFVTKEAAPEIKEYRLKQIANKRQIRGTVTLQLDVVVALLNEILRYIQGHPKEALESAAAVVVIEDYLERKLGKVGVAIWNKMTSKPNSPRKEINQLRKLRAARNVKSKLSEAGRRQDRGLRLRRRKAKVKRTHPG